MLRGLRGRGRMATFKANILRSSGCIGVPTRQTLWARKALLAAEHRKPESRRPRKVTYFEIMEDLATGNPGSLFDRKIQSLLSLEYVESLGGKLQIVADVAGKKVDLSSMVERSRHR